MSLPRSLTATLSVQSRGGLVFGSATQIDGSNLTFELEAQMEVGDNVEWRMELSGLDDTAMGRMRIVSRRADAGYPVRWVGAIMSVSPDDSAVFEVWRRGVEAGTRAFTVSKRPPTDSWLASTTMVGSSEAERRQAVAIEEARRKQRLERAKCLVKNAKSWPDPVDTTGGASVASGVFRSSLAGSVSHSAGSVHGSNGPVSGVHSTSSAAGVSRPRLAMAAALRANIGAERPAGARAAPSVVTPAPRGPAPAAAVPAFSVPSAPFAEVPPTVMLDRGMASVRFTDRPSFQTRQKPGLMVGILVVPLCAAGAAGTAMQFLFTLPSGMTLFSSGSVMAHSATRTEFQVQLTAAQKATLAAE